LNSQSLRKVRSFTLLEMTIVLAILSLIGAFSAIHITKLIGAHRFESEISHLFIVLQEAQVLSSVYKTDIALDISRQQGKLCYRFSTNEPFTFQQLNQKESALKQTASIGFKGKKISKLHIDIFSGRIEPRGILAFFQTQEEDSRALWFDLQQGQLLKFSYRKPALPKQQIPSRPTKK
jgi:prepilin-type N-terminal cleavage/methylation domain-containing protein